MRFRTLALLFVPMVACSAFSSTSGSGSSSGSSGSSPQDGGGEGGPGTVTGGGPQPGQGSTPLTGIFVSSSKGSPSGDGTIGKPFSTIGAGIAAAAPTGEAVIVCAEQAPYDEALTLASGVSVWGNYDCTQTPWQIQTTPASVVSPTSPAVIANGITAGATLASLSITAPPGTPSSIGLLASGSPALLLTDVTITAGDAAAGADGQDPTALQNDPNVSASGVQGGSNTCGGMTGTVTGGTGGNGQSAGSYQCQGMLWMPKTNPGNLNVGTGNDGASGTNGASCQTSYGAFSANGYQTCDGTPGTSGDGGAGATGGKQVGQPTNPPACPNGTIVDATNGFGSGAGGCAGLAGTVGHGGGASIAVLMVDGPIGLGNAVLKTGLGGQGGKGTGGSAPTQGGAAGGTGASAGSPGGMPGYSGSGGGGPSVCVVYPGTVSAPDTTKVQCVAGTPGVGVADFTALNGVPVPHSADGAGGSTLPY